MRIKITCVALFFFTLFSLPAQILRLVAPEYAPFTTLHEGRPSGLGVDLVARVMTSAGLYWTVEIVPNYARCLATLEDGSADGFFLGSTHPERDRLAVFTLPLLNNRWIWVTRAQESILLSQGPPPAGLRVGVLLNTNPHAWLKDHDYPIVGTPGRPESLVNMLEIDRVNAILVPEKIFREVVATSKRSLESFRLTRHSDNPFGLYLSRKFLETHPEVLGKVNQAIRDTIPGLVEGL